MESLSHVIRVSLPKYLASLPVPESVVGFFHLSFGEWLSLTPLGLIVAGTTYMSYRALTTSVSAAAETSKGQRQPIKKKSKVNEEIKKDNPKVVDTFDIEEIGDKKVFCRCWRSAKFPMCDGSHTKHNEETGDNVGPLIIKK